MQRAARVARGVEKMKFPAYYKDSSICGTEFNYLFDESQDWRWQPQSFKNCWYIDALTIDPSRMKLLPRGIWDRLFKGAPPEVQSNLTSANVGMLPAAAPHADDCRTWWNTAVHHADDCRTFWYTSLHHGREREH